MKGPLVLLVAVSGAGPSYQGASNYEKLGASVVQEYCNSGRVTVVEVHDRTLFFIDDVGEFLHKRVERDQANRTAPIGCTVKTVRLAPDGYRNPYGLDKQLRSGDFEVVEVITNWDGRAVPWLVYLRGRQLLRLSYSVDPDNE